MKAAGEVGWTKLVRFAWTMQQLADAGKLTLDDVKDLERAIRKRSQQQDAERTRRK